MTPEQRPEVVQVDYAREALSRQEAERIVAARIEQWGWGPISDIDGLAEHELAVRACQAGIATALERAAQIADRMAEKDDSLDAYMCGSNIAAAIRALASHPERRSEK